MIPKEVNELLDEDLSAYITIQETIKAINKIVNLKKPAKQLQKVHHKLKNVESDSEYLTAFIDSDNDDDN